MKLKIFVFAILSILCFPQLSFAEDSRTAESHEYIPLIKEGVEWTYKHVPPMEEGDGHVIERFRFYGKQTLNGEEWKQVCVYTDDKPFNPDHPNILALVREEDCKVYLYKGITTPKNCYEDFGTDETGTLLYDFNQPEGGMYDLSLSRNDRARMTVSVVSETSINGKPHIVQTLKSGSKIVEGIGGVDNGSFLFPYIIGGEPMNGSSRSKLCHLRDLDGNIILFYGDIFHDELNTEPPASAPGTYAKIIKQGNEYIYSSKDYPKIILKIENPIQICDKEWFSVRLKYSGTNDSKNYIAGYVREGEGRLYGRANTEVNFPNSYYTEGVENLNCDFEARVGEIIRFRYFGGSPKVKEINVLQSDFVEVGGIRRKRITTDQYTYIEGLGIVDGGYLFMPSYLKDVKLEKVTDADGNVVFSRDMLSGVEEISAGEESVSEPQYYDLTGRRVASPEKGIYIVKDSGGVRKVIL